MNDCYQQNMTVIRQRWPGLASQLDKVAEQAPALALAIAEGADSTLLVNGIQLTSRHNRALEARQQATPVHLEPQVTLYGTGLGDLQLELLSWPSLQGLRVKILNESLFCVVLQLLDQRSWLNDPRVQLAVAGDDKELQPPYVVLPAELVLASDFNQKIRQRLCSELEVDNVRHRLAAQITPLLPRLQQNQPFWRRDKQVQQLFGTIPTAQQAFVIAAGPSLEQHYVLLKQSRLQPVAPVLICVDTAVKALLTHNIVPDIIVTVDYLVSTRHLPVSQLPASCKLVYFPITNTDILTGFPGERYVAMNDTQMFASIREQLNAAKLFMHGSVIHPATDLAVQMGATEVVFFGADFAFSHQKTHASWQDGEIGIPYQQASEWVMNADGEKVPTLPNFMTYLIGLERYIRRHPTVRFYNTSRAGAVIDGTIYHPEYTTC